MKKYLPETFKKESGLGGAGVLAWAIFQQYAAGGVAGIDYNLVAAFVFAAYCGLKGLHESHKKNA